MGECVMTDKIIAVDIDGIFANFIQTALDRWALLTGNVFHHDSIDDHKMEIAMKLWPADVARFSAIFHSPGFCSTIKLYPDAQDVMQTLKKLGKVHPVTAPTASATWARERELWLEHNFGFHRDDIVSTAAKHLIYADVFVEDTYKTLVAWHARHPDGTAILLTRKYNAHENMTELGARVDQLIDLPEVVDAALKGQRCRESLAL